MSKESEIQRKIKNRDTEIQRAWDLVNDSISDLTLKRDRLLAQLDEIAPELDMQKALKSKIHIRAIELGYEHIL